MAGKKRKITREPFSYPRELTSQLDSYGGTSRPLQDLALKEEFAKLNNTKSSIPYEQPIVRNTEDVLKSFTPNGASPTTKISGSSVPLRNTPSIKLSNPAQPASIATPGMVDIQPTQAKPNILSNIGSKIVNGKPGVSEVIRGKLPINAIKGGAMLAPSFIASSNILGNNNTESLINDYTNKEQNNFKQPILSELSQGIQNPSTLPKHLANIASDGIASAWNSSDFGNTKLGSAIGNFAGGLRQTATTVNEYPYMAKANQAIQQGIAGGIDLAGFGYNDSTQQIGSVIPTQIPTSATSPVNQTSPFKNTGLPNAEINSLLQQRQPTQNMSSVEQPKTNVLGEPIQATGVEGVQVQQGANGVPMYSKTGTVPNTSGIKYDDMSPGRTTINGKVDRNSEWFKRNDAIAHPSRITANVGGIQYNTGNPTTSNIDFTQMESRPEFLRRY